MTHEELLDAVKDNPTTRAVVELHKPNKYNLCEICRWYMNKHKYPCPTIQKIIEELK